LKKTKDLYKLGLYQRYLVRDLNAKIGYSADLSLLFSMDYLSSKIVRKSFYKCGKICKYNFKEN